nr:hypothetical protein [Euzebyaceae bacterium]
MDEVEAEVRRGLYARWSAWRRGRGNPRVRERVSERASERAPDAPPRPLAVTDPVPTSLAEPEPADAEVDCSAVPD